MVWSQPVKGATSKKTKLSPNPWLVIFLLAPLPIILLGLLFYKYSTARNEFNRLNKQMVERQNRVLGNDATTIAQEVAHLLEGAARDAQALSLIRPTAENYFKFYLSRISQVNQLDPRDESINTIPLPVYNELAYLNSQGDEVLRLKNGQRVNDLRPKKGCLERNLCDRKTLDAILNDRIGSIRFGSLMRWYNPEGIADDTTDAQLPVLFRTSDGIFRVSIDYRYFKNILTLPTFPYERKKDILHSYQNGNYIYLVDDGRNFVAHPKYWHVTGIERATGTRIPNLKVDSEEGKRPLNVAEYQGEKLKEYFSRLLNRSFLQKSVDIFEASNLGGTRRILSVAPVLLSKGQFQQTGVFGYVIVGCSVDYFEEPKEQYVPYY